MDLKKRLASLDRLTRKPSAGATPAVGRADAEQVALGRLGLRKEDTALGPCFFRDLQDDLPPPEGRLPDLTGFLTRPDPGGLDPTELLFLDTETTGLVGGTGTLVFLVGASWWQEGRFHTRQFFLCGPEGEAALLARLHELAGRYRAVATFNGASFDLPLLRTRALLNRQDHPWDSLASWDLLVAGRRLWGTALPDCRQQTLESRVCRLVRRQQDIAGHLIPQTWFALLQGGSEAADLPRVLYHNHADMLGLGHIFSTVVRRARLLAHPEGAAPLDWQDAWALGRVAEKRGEVALSVAWMDRARHLALRDDPAAFALPRFTADLLRILKRSGNWPVVQEVIDQALASGQNTWWLHREAAILYEHRLVDLDRALDHALAAGQAHRVDRLQAKLAIVQKEQP